MMDSRGWGPLSHILDDVRSTCSSDDEACSIDGDAGLVRGLSISQKGGDDALSLADACAYVNSPDAPKSSFTISAKRSSARAVKKPSKQQYSPVSTVVASTTPSKPVKWQLRLADRSTAAVNVEAHYQVPPHVLFDLLADPFQHERIFDAIEAADAELLEEEGNRKKWRLDYTARWNFWKVSGLCENRLYMWTDRDAGTVSFKLREPGFLRRYEGTWTIKPACGTPMSDCYDGFSPFSSVSSSPTSSRSSSRSASPLRGAVPPLGSSTSGNIAASNSCSSVVSSWSSPTSAGAGIRVSPLASVNLMSSAAGGAGSSGNFLPPVRLTGAVAAIARMQAAFQESVNTSMTNLSSLGSTIASNTPGNNSNVLHNMGQALQGQLSALQSPWNNMLPSSSGSSSAQNDTDTASLDQQRQQQQRKQLPTSAIIMAETFTSPKITPPYPLNSLLKNQSKGQVQDMLEGLVKSAAAAVSARQQQQQQH